MRKNVQSVRGMHDCLPQDAIIWKYVERVFERVLISYGYNEIRFPIVEFSSLFQRSIGEVTDVVEKEMYSFGDRNGESLTLRPEGTSGCVRAGIENGLFYHQEQRLWYLGPMFRYERPQKGRYRQFHQFSAEVFGQVGPSVDAELILITARCWKILGLSRYLSLEINSIGSLESRKKYQEALVRFLRSNLDCLDNSTISRLSSNPIRILDTKNDKIIKLLLGAPKLIDYLDEDSCFHFSELCKLLDSFGVLYSVNPNLVRGLDYYNRTVFEWVTDKLGAKNTVCAGGRYDELVQQLGGREVPAAGFAVGLERVLLLMREVKSIILNKKIRMDIYIISIGENTQKFSIELSENIRDILPSLRIIVNYCCNKKDSIKKQFTCAYQNNVRFILVINEKNIFDKKVILKDISLGNQEILDYKDVLKKIKFIFDM